jgi:type IV pilus assembly protein PilO
MQQLFDRLAAVPLLAKLGALAGALVLLLGGYWYFLYSDMQDEMQHLQEQAEKLNKEKAEYEKRKQEYLAFRNEVNTLLEEQKELLRVLPKSDDIEQFIENVQAQIELAGLTKVASVRDPAQPVEMYVKIPIRMSLVGSYHQINHFFKTVGELKRIVNIEDLSMTPAGEPQTNVGVTAATMLNAKFVATTFQFQEKGKPGGPARTSTTIQSTPGGRR